MSIRAFPSVPKLKRNPMLAVVGYTLVLLVGLLWLLTVGRGDAQNFMSASSAGIGPVVVRAQPQRKQYTLDQFPHLASISTMITCTLETTTTDQAPYNNHSFETAASIANYTDQALAVGDKGAGVPPTADFYRLDNASIGTKYIVQAKPDWTTNYNLGIIVYDKNKVPILTDTNTFDNNFASVTLVAESHGPYFFKVFQISEQCSGHTYSLILSAIAPTPTSSPTPTSTPQPTAPPPQPTWRSGFDQYEPNYSFEIATTIAPGISYDMNFIPWGGASVDNDFLKIRVKPGLQLTCETSNLDPGVDPRIALYSGPSEQYFITANDDITLGDFNSRVTYYATYEGYVYILVGQGNRMSPEDTANSNYTITCDLTAPKQPTSPPNQPPADKEPTATPPPAIATATPTPQVSVIATPVPPTVVNTELTFRLIQRPQQPTPSPEPTGFRTFRVMVYFDGNLDGQMGAGEGVAGLFIMVLSPDATQKLAQGYTDDQGQLSFTVPTIGSVRILAPLLGFDQLLEASRPEVRIRILPPPLPEVIP